MKIKGYVFIFTAACLWGIIGPISRAAFAEGIAPLEVAFWRAVLSWGCFAAHAIRLKQTHIEKQDLFTLPVFGITGVALFYGAYQLAVQEGGAALASVLLYTAPAWVTIMAGFLFKEAVTPLKAVALVLTLAGVAGVSFAGGGLLDRQDTISTTGIFFGLLSGFCYSLYYIFGKHFSDRYSAPNLFLYILPVGAAALLPFVTFHEKSPTAWMALITIAIVSTYMAYYCYYLGLKYLEASRASIAATIEPMVAAVVAYFWWEEVFTWIGYAGAFLILTAVLLTISDSLRTDAKSDTRTG